MRRVERWALLLALGLAACDGVDDPGSDAGAPREDAALEQDGGSGDEDAGRDGGAAGDAGDPGDAGDVARDAGPPPSRLDAYLARLEDPAASEGDLDALLHEVAWREGWPVGDGTRWLFATRWDGAPGAVSLVSDVNDWAPSRGAATRAASGVHYWAVLDAADFDVPAPGAAYKWHGAPDVFRVPPEATAYGFDAFGEHGYVAPPTDARWRERFPAFESAHLEAPRALRALLPAGFTHGDAARALLLHDGQNVFHPDSPFGGWRVDEAVGAPGYEDVIVLAVDNAPDRMSAYTHVPDRIGGGVTGGRAEDYLQLIEAEALPFFRARYGVAAAGDALVIGGSSLGGLVSLYAAQSRPSLARCVIAMSSTLGWGAFDPSADGSDALVHRWTTRGATAVYLDSGGSGTCGDPDGDGVFEDSDDRDNFCVTNQLRDHFESLGYTHGADLFHWHEAGAGHNEAAWAARISRGLASCASAGWSVPS